MACVSVLSSDPASAQATRTWVSGVGDDVNPCSRTAPCKTFAGAISKTAAGGEINCLDPGGFGAVTITKSMTIDCEGTFGSILAAGTNGVNVNDSATATPGTIRVILRNISINGAGSGLVGINFVSGSSLELKNVKIFGFNTGNAQGIRLVGNTGGQLTMLDSVISNNGTSSAGGGVFVDPVAGSSLVTMHRVQIVKNFEGFRATGAGGGLVRASIFDSFINQNGTNGVAALAPGGGGDVNIQIQGSAISHNGSQALLADGGTAIIFVGTSMMSKNSTAFTTLNGGQIKSYGNNAVDSIGGNGSPTPPNATPL